MRKLIEDCGANLVATAAVAFAIGYSLANCDINSYISGFASGVAALMTSTLWLD